MKIRVQFVMLLLTITMAASSLSVALARLLQHLLVSDELTARGAIVFLALKEILVPITTVLICVALAGIMSKKVVSSIVDLTNATKKIAQGEFDVVITESNRKDEVSELRRNFNLMAEELKGNELMRKDFIANISHEFKTPLSIIEGYSELLTAETVSDEERKQCAQTIQQESVRLIGLSSNILRLSRLNAQAIQTASTHFKLDEQLRQAVLLLTPTWEKRGITFDIALYDQPYFGDEELLSQVWLNIIENAIKFSHDGGVVHIRCKHSKSGVQVEVADHGIGMDEATKSNMFEQFYQGDTSRSGEGSGLGLAIVKRIVELHRGDITIESSPGAGTKFHVLLPLAQH